MGARAWLFALQRMITGMLGNGSGCIVWSRKTLSRKHTSLLLSLVVRLIWMHQGMTLVMPELRRSLKG